MTNRIVNPQGEETVISDERVAEFLLREYDRLVEYQKLTIESYDRWFRIYLTVASAAIVLLVPLVQTVTSGSQPIIVNIILLGLLALGAADFIGLSSSNAISTQYERAIMLIQDYFIEREPSTVRFLHFRTRRMGISGTGFRALVLRGLTGGSPKSMLVLINSIVTSVLAVKVGVESRIARPSALLEIIIALLVFLFTAMLHVLYSRIVYDVHGIGKPVFPNTQLGER